MKRWIAIAGTVVIVGLLAIRTHAIDLLPLPSTLESWRTVGSYFDDPPAWPGPAWTRDNRTIGWDELVAAAGPAHCDMQSMTILTIGWPPGTRARNSGQARQYIRDPTRNAQLANMRGTWAHNPVRPSDAYDTGYRYGVVKLYLAPSDQDRYVYLVAPADSERWSRSDPMTVCS